MNVAAGDTDSLSEHKFGSSRMDVADAAGFLGGHHHHHHSQIHPNQPLASLLADDEAVVIQLTQSPSLCDPSNTLEHAYPSGGYSLRSEDIDRQQPITQFMKTPLPMSENVEDEADTEAAGHGEVYFLRMTSTETCADLTSANLSLQQPSARSFLAMTKRSSLL